MKHNVYMHATKDAATLSSLDIQSQSFLSEKVQAKKGKKNGVLKGGIFNGNYTGNKASLFRYSGTERQ